MAVVLAVLLVQAGLPAAGHRARGNRVPFTPRNFGKMRGETLRDRLDLDLAECGSRSGRRIDDPRHPAIHLQPRSLRAPCELGQVVEHLSAVRKLTRRQPGLLGLKREGPLRPRFPAGACPLHPGPEAPEADRVSCADVVTSTAHVVLAPRIKFRSNPVSAGP